MSQAAVSAGNGRFAWIAGWALATAILILGSGVAALHQDFGEPDNAMRLVRVRDFLGGQGWFDAFQHRLNPPDGTPMHWARWIDVAIAAPVALLTPVIGQINAEITAAFVWPLGLLAIFMALVVEVSGELGVYDGQKAEAQWAGAIVAALAFPVIDKFGPSAFDHHNIEIICGFAAMLGLMKMRKHPRMGVLAGVALGVALGTAAEAVPLVVAGLAIAGLVWLARPMDFTRGLAWLGGALGVTSLVMFGISVPMADWGRPVCDAMGAPFLGFGLMGGGVALALGWLPDSLMKSLAWRFVSATVLGGVALAALILLFPECAGGGYAAMSADMQRLWMVQISETRSLAALAGDDPAMILSIAGAAFAGLVAAALFLRKRWRGPDGWIVLAFLLAGWAVLAWQIRGAAFATAFAIPFGAWAVARARHVYRSKASTIRLLAFAGVAASSAAAAWASAGEALQARLTPKQVMASYEARSTSAAACDTPDAFKPLANVPTGVMLNQFTLGADVLVWSKHSVLAGPYHRDVSGTMTMINALRATPEAARVIVQASVADYVLVCPAAPETSFYAHHATDGVAPEATLSAVLGRDEHPVWLEPVALGASPLRLYRVVR